MYTTQVGDYLVVMITGMLDPYIAEITESEPLRLKVMEEGPFARLQQGDFIVLETHTARLQEDRRNGTDSFLREEHLAGRKVVSGLKSLGVEDGNLREILPKA